MKPIRLNSEARSASRCRVPGKHHNDRERLNCPTEGTVITPADVVVPCLRSTASLHSPHPTGNPENRVEQLRIH